MDTQRHRNYELLVLLAVVIASLVATGINPHSRLTWFSEVLWVLAGIPILVLTYALILIVGGYYTYARVPLGLWVQDRFDLSRNHYDRLGHFAQGFVPAILARELLLRRSPLVKGKWLFFIVVSVCLAFSAFFEMIEWWYALLVGGESAVDFLGSQGDVWDAQWDMFFALIGAISAQLMLARVHDRSIEKVETGMGQEPTCGENSSS
jgi:putative membrane protein